MPWHKTNIHEGSDSVGIGNELRDAVKHIHRLLVNVSCENAHKIFGRKNLAMEVQGRLSVSGLRPFWAAFEFVVAIRGGSPVRIAAAETHGTSRDAV